MKDWKVGKEGVDTGTKTLISRFTHISMGRMELGAQLVGSIVQ